MESAHVIEGVLSYSNRTQTYIHISLIGMCIGLAIFCFYGLKKIKNTTEKRMGVGVVIVVLSFLFYFYSNSLNINNTASFIFTDGNILNIIPQDSLEVEKTIDLNEYLIKQKGNKVVLKNKTESNNIVTIELISKEEATSVCYQLQQYLLENSSLQD